MAQQMINEQTFSPDSIARLKTGAGSTRGMTVAGTVLKSLVLFVLTCASGSSDGTTPIASSRPPPDRHGSSATSC